MNVRSKAVAAGVLALAVGVLIAEERPRFKRQLAPVQPIAAAAGGKDDGREADREAIKKSARDFQQAFAKGDAKACAAYWTENGEFIDEDNAVRGRANIEKTFAEFFKEKPNAKVQLVIGSIRFPARDLAVEDGIIRQEGLDKELPTSTRYNVLHVREGGLWKIAVCREWGASHDRLEDLGWLVGTWTATVKDQDVSLTFERDPAKAYITGQFTKKEKGKTVGSGTMRIALDPQSGQLRSWHFDDDGGHGQAHWIRDGNRWALDAAGVTADGLETAGINLLGRVGADQITWRSVERVVGDQPLPDTLPIKLTRVRGSK